MRWRAAACAGLLAATAQPAHAASDDRSKVAEIFADRVSMDEQAQRSRYVGNVEFTQGSLRLTGDEVELATRDGQLQRLNISGSPATYRELDDAGQPLRARAEKIEYDTAVGLIRLQGDAHLCRGGEYFRSTYIEYNTQTRAVDAGKPEAGGQDRVHITLRPGNAAPGSGCDEMP